MFIVSKALLMSSATMMVRAGGAIWLNPFATVLFTVCSAVTVEYCVLYPCCVGAFLVCLLLFMEEGSSQVSVITKWRDMDMYEVGALVYVFVWFVFVNFHMCGIIIIIIIIYI